MPSPLLLSFHCELAFPPVAAAYLILVRSMSEQSLESTFPDVWTRLQRLRVISRIGISLLAAFSAVVIGFHLSAQSPLVLFGLVALVASAGWSHSRVLFFQCPRCRMLFFTRAPLIMFQSRCRSCGLAKREAHRQT